MGADVITIDGLPTKNAKAPSSKPCGQLVEVHMAVLGRNMRVCERDIEDVKKAPGVGAKKRGRPRGSTVKNGARAPKKTACSSAKVITRKDGRRICKCADQGNSRILKNEKCGI